MTDVDDANALVVAKTYLGNTLPLKAGDAIKGVEGVPGQIQNEAQLFHALRGRLDNFALRIVRDGKPMVIAGSLPPAPNILDRKGISVSGVMFGLARFRDTPVLDLGREPVKIHHIANGSVASTLHLGEGDFVVTVDGEAINGLNDLLQRLRQAEKADLPVTLVLKNWSNKRDTVFDYKTQVLPVTDVSVVTPRF